MDATHEKSCFARMVELGVSAVCRDILRGDGKSKNYQTTLTSETYLSWLQENKAAICRTLAGIDKVQIITKQTSFKKSDKSSAVGFVQVQRDERMMETEYVKEKGKSLLEVKEDAEAES